MTPETAVTMKEIFDFITAVLTILTPIALAYIGWQSRSNGGAIAAQTAKLDTQTGKLETIHDTVNSNFKTQTDALAKQTDALATANATIAGLSEKVGQTNAS